MNNRAFLLEAVENGIGFAAGMDRGTELLAIGEPGQALTNVSTLLASGGPRAVINALGPSTDGLQRTIRFAQVGGNVIEETITKSDFSLNAISDRYGALILNDGGKQVGISTSAHSSLARQTAISITPSGGSAMPGWTSSYSTFAIMAAGWFVSPS